MCKAFVGTNFLNGGNDVKSSRKNMRMIMKKKRSGNLHLHQPGMVVINKLKLFLGMIPYIYSDGSWKTLFFNYSDDSSI
jgi:hypothetical protein